MSKIIFNKGDILIRYDLDALFFLELKSLNQEPQEEYKFRNLIKEYIVKDELTFIGKKKFKYVFSYIPFGEFNVHHTIYLSKKNIQKIFFTSVSESFFIEYVFADLKKRKCLNLKIDN